MTELAVARAVYEHLKRLNGVERDRIMTWVNSRLAADVAKGSQP